jgi:rubrerythrin
MNLEAAIKSALEYENRVEDLYAQAADKAEDDVAKRVFRTLADEERGHVRYLRSRLDEWQKNGHLSPEKLETAFPPREVIEEGVRQLVAQSEPRPRDCGVELSMLQQALAMEVETSAFYARMVKELDDEGRKLFERFLQIEEGHKAIVQAQIDSVTGLGFWFDYQEFDLSAG